MKTSVRTLVTGCALLIACTLIAADAAKIDLKDVNKKLTALNDSIKKSTEEHNKYLKELGLNPI